MMGIEFERPLMALIALAGVAVYVLVRTRLGPRLARSLIVLYNPLARRVRVHYTARWRLVIVEAVAVGLGLLALSGPVLSYTVVIEGEERSESILEVPPRPGLVLVIDVSGSMGGWKLEAVKKAAVMLVDSLDERIDVGVVSFSHTLGPSIPPTSDRAMVKQLISNLTSMGGTMYTYPLHTAYSWLMVYRSYGLPAAIVFLSDGIPADRTSFWSVVEDMKEDDIVIYTIYTGDSALGVSLLKDMAKATGGESYSADNAEGILEAFMDIARKANETLIKAVAEAEAVLRAEITVRKPLWSYIVLASLATGLMATFLRFLEARLFF